MFLKNKNIIFKIRRPKVTDYAALNFTQSRFSNVCTRRYLGSISKVSCFIISQVHNFQKLKNISLEAVNFLATNTKVTCLSESVFFHLHISELLLFSRPCG